MQLSSVPAALGKACEKGRCHPANPGAANKAKPRQPQKHQHSWVHILLSPANRPKEDTEVSFSRPGCSPTQLISLSHVLIRAPKLRDSEPKPILFQSDFVRALFAFLKTSPPALSSYRWEKTTGVEVNPKGSPGRMAVLRSCLYWLSVGCLSGSLYLPRTAGLGCLASNHLALLFPPILRALGILLRGSQRDDVTALENCTLSTNQITRMIPPSTSKIPRAEKLCLLWQERKPQLVQNLFPTSSHLGSPFPSSLLLLQAPHP